MEDTIQSINTFLSSQPWWVIALGTVFIMGVLTRKIRFSVSAGDGPKRDFKDQISAVAKPINFESGSHTSVKISSAGQKFSNNANTDVQSFNISVEGDDAQKLLSLLKSGDKIGAIKLLREMKGLDLVEAKNIVEAMEKLS